MVSQESNNLLTLLSNLSCPSWFADTCAANANGLAIASLPLIGCNSENLKNYLLLSVSCSAFKLVVGGAESLPILSCEKKLKFPSEMTHQH